MVDNRANKTYNLLEQNGKLVVQESIEHKKRRLASYMLHLKLLAPAVVIMNILWIFSRIMMKPFDCSTMKRFEDRCFCDDGAMRGLDGFRFYFSFYGASVAVIMTELYKVSRIRHGKRVQLHDILTSTSRQSVFIKSMSSLKQRISRRSSGVSEQTEAGTGTSSDTVVSERVVDKEQERLGEVDNGGNVGALQLVPVDPAQDMVNLWGLLATPDLHPLDIVPLPVEGARLITREVILLGFVYGTSMGLFLGVLKTSSGTAMVVYCLYVIRRLKVNARRLIPTNPSILSRPVVYTMCLLIGGAAVVSVATLMLESNPSYADAVTTLFPAFTSTLEVLVLDVLGPHMGIWSDEDSSALARKAVLMVEAFRVGSLMSAATLDLSSPLRGPFFSSLVFGTFTDMLMRNDIFTTLMRKLRGWSDAKIVKERCRFTMVYVGVKTDTCYVPWIIVLMFYLHNWAPSSGVVDCDMHVFHAFSPPFSFIAAGIIGEVCSDLGAHALRKLLHRFRPLWVVPLYHVSTEGTPVLRVVMWLGWMAFCVVALAGTGIMLGNMEEDVN